MPIRLTLVDAGRMAVEFLVRVLFALALLAQTLAPSAVAFGMPAPRTGVASHGPLCALLHSGARQAAVADASSEQAPKHDSAHRHFCSYCQIGSGTPPFEPRLATGALLRLSWTRPIFEPYRDAIIAFRANRNAPARAPPSLA